MPAFCAQVDSDAAEGEASPGVRAVLVGIELQAVVTAGDDHGEQARMDRRLFGDAEVHGHARVGTAAGVGDRVRTLPRWPRDVPVVYVHPHSPSEA